MALLGSSPLRMASVSISTRASYSPYSAWKCAGLWSLKYIRTTIPKNRVTSGISSLDSTLSGRPAPGNLRRPHRPSAAVSPAPLGPRLRCDCAVTSAVCGGVSDHRGNTNCTAPGVGTGHPFPSRSPPDRGRVNRWLCRRGEAVADPGLGEDIPRLGGVGFDLLAD